MELFSYRLNPSEQPHDVVEPDATDLDDYEVDLSINGILDISFEEKN